VNPSDVLHWLDDRLLLAIDSGSFVSRPLEAAFRAANGLAAAAVDTVVPVTRWTGTIGGHPMTIVAAGRSHWAQYLARRAGAMGSGGGREVGGSLAPEALRPVTLAGLPAALRLWEQEADVVTVRAGVLASSLLRGRYLRLPEWVSFSYPLVPYRPPEVACGRSVRHSLVEIKQGRTSYEVSRRPEDLRFFYERVYRPTALFRHGDEARIFDFLFLVMTFGRTGVMWVLRDGQRVGGVAFDRCGPALRARLLGVVDADPEFYRIHVPALIYYHFIQMARKAGYSLADFGGCRAPLTDGLTAHKVRWGMVPRVKKDSHFNLNLRVCRDTLATRRFVASLPCFLEVRRRLGVLAVHDPASPEAATGLALAEEVRGGLPKILVDLGDLGENGRPGDLGENGRPGDLGEHDRPRGFSKIVKAPSGLVAALDGVLEDLGGLVAGRPAG
jgi:hypothetical protein